MMTEDETNKMIKFLSSPGTDLFTPEGIKIFTLFVDHNEQAALGAIVLCAEAKQTIDAPVLQDLFSKSCHALSATHQAETLLMIWKTEHSLPEEKKMNIRENALRTLIISRMVKMCELSREAHTLGKSVVFLLDKAKA